MIRVCVPCMDMMHTLFVRSLTRLLGDYEVDFCAGSLIYDARNKLAFRAMSAGAEKVLWLDSDMVFDENLLLNLLSDEKDIVCGLYTKRVPPFSPVIFDEKFNAITDIQITPFEVTYCGFGAVLMNTDVLRAVSDNGFLFSPEAGMGEDLTFCRRARNLGYKIYCDPRIKLGHISYSVATIDAWQKGQ